MFNARVAAYARETRPNSLRSRRCGTATGANGTDCYRVLVLPPAVGDRFGRSGRERWHKGPHDDRSTRLSLRA